MLQFNKTWRFDSPGPVPAETADAIWGVIGKVVAQGGDQSIVEQWKPFFAAVSGDMAHTSSSRSWALSDLRTHFDDAATNCPLFLEAFYDTCVTIAANNPSLAVPDLDYVNAVLAKTNSGFQIDPPNLVASRDYQPVSVVSAPASLETQARELISSSLDQSQIFLEQNRPRQAVLEILWLMETISTAFRGVELQSATIEGRYFNAIAKEMRAASTGSTLDRALKWLTELHGYLSSPTGGGVRHGTDLKSELSLTMSEARLYCNLMRSYISFLLDEHERLAVKR